MKKILLCEDDSDLRNIIRMTLNKEFEIIESENGKRGLEMIASEQPDLVLLDIMMPEMDGLAMLKELRSRNETKDLPVIMLTNVAFDETKLKTLLDLGASSYILKADLAAESFLSKIHSALDM